MNEQETSQVRDAVTGMAFLMEQRLAEHDSEHPDGWACPTDEGRYQCLNDLFMQMDDHFNSLFNDLEGDEDAAAISHCIDIANYAMMIADNLGAYGVTVGR